MWLIRVSSLYCNDWHVWAIRLWFLWQEKCCSSGLGWEGVGHGMQAAVRSTPPDQLQGGLHAVPRYHPWQNGRRWWFAPEATINDSDQQILETSIRRQRNVSWLMARSKRLMWPRSAHECVANHPQIRQSYCNGRVILRYFYVAVILVFFRVTINHRVENDHTASCWHCF